MRNFSSIIFTSFNSANGLLLLIIMLILQPHILCFHNIYIKYAVADIVDHINYNITRHFLRLSMKNCDIWRIR